MGKIPGKVTFNNHTGKLVIEPESKKLEQRPEDILRWLSEKGLSSDRPQFQSLVRSHLMREKEVIEGEIEGMLLHIHDLYKAMRKRWLELKIYNYTLAPIMVIPHDVLRRILTFLAPASDQLNTWQVLKSLLQVCRSWRSTVYDMPVMWENITITGSYHGDKWLTLQLEKAKVTRVNVSWRVYGKSLDLSEALLSCLQLWRRFCVIESGPREIAPRNLYSALRKAESLEELTLHGSWYQLQPSDGPMILPSIMILRLESCSSLPTFILPTLTELYLDKTMISWDQLQKFADQSPNLRRIATSQAFVTRGDRRETVGTWGTPFSPLPKFQALEQLQVLKPQDECHPLWLAIAAGTSSRPTVLLTARVLFAYRLSQANGLHHTRSLIIVVDMNVRWEVWIERPLLHLFSGVEDVELRLERCKRKEVHAAATQTASLLKATMSTTNTDHSALFPHLKRLSLSFHYSTKQNLSNWVFEMLSSLVDAAIVWRCPVSLQTEDGIVFFAATAEEFGHLIADFENSWPSIRDAIHKTVPLG